MMDPSDEPRLDPLLEDILTAELIEPELVIRYDAGAADLSAEERARVEAWLAARPNRDALAAMKRLHTILLDADRDTAPLASKGAPPRAPRRSPGFAWRAAVVASGAAAALVLLLRAEQPPQPMSQIAQLDRSQALDSPLTSPDAAPTGTAAQSGTPLAPLRSPFLRGNSSTEDPAKQDPVSSKTVSATRTDSPAAPTPEPNEEQAIADARMPSDLPAIPPEKPRLLAKRDEPPALAESQSESTTDVITSGPTATQDTPPIQLAILAPEYRAAQASSFQKLDGPLRGSTVESGAFAISPADHYGWTANDRPTLYWHLDALPPANAMLRLTVVDEAADEDHIDLALERPTASGLQRVVLPRALEPHHDYRWSISIARDPDHPALDEVTSGGIRFSPAPAEIAAQVKDAAPGQQSAIWAGAGYFYDAFDALQTIADALVRAPDSAVADALTADSVGRIRDAQASLLRQAGVDASRIQLP